MILRSTSATSSLGFRPLAVAIAWLAAASLATPELTATETPAPPNPAVVLNVKDYGAIGDGQIHLVDEWIKQGRFKTLRALQRAYPAVKNATWSIDEAAFELAKSKLPVSGGTIYFPAGHYIATAASWTIWRDHVTLRGESAASTTLATGPAVSDALSVSPYRHVGWLERPEQQYSFSSASGARGTSTLLLDDSSWSADFQAGDLVFIRNGACRYDQDYGEFNEIASVSPAGELIFRHPFARDYTLPQLNGANIVAADFKVPAARRESRLKVATGPGKFLPARGETISVGDTLFEVLSASGDSIRIRPTGRSSTRAGTVIPAGTPVGKSRAVLKLTRSTRGFRAENLQFIGRRKVLNLSNSYDLTFSDCIFVRAPDRGMHGDSGLTIDGDGGRWATFTRCTVRATPPWGMQFARSFGGVMFAHCAFENATAAFTEFNFDCEISDSTFTLTTSAPGPVIVVGKSGGDFRVLRNRIDAGDATSVFDAQTDIQSHQHAGEGGLVIAGNRIRASAATQLFRLNQSRVTELTDNLATR